MKALSLKQPYAELVVSGKKTIELRKWNTNFRGEFLVHASKIPDEDAMKRFGFANLPFGFIIGKANLINVKHYNSKEEHADDKYKHLANSDWGNFGFILENPERINTIPAKGKLNFWNSDI
jgi:hypothetical protein